MVSFPANSQQQTGQNKINSHQSSVNSQQPTVISHQLTVNKILLIQELHDIQAAAGATFAELTTKEIVPVSFGNDAEAIAATKQGVALYDRTHWGRIQISDSDGCGSSTIKVPITSIYSNQVKVATPFRHIHRPDDRPRHRLRDRRCRLLLVSANRRRQLLELLDGRFSQWIALS